MKRYRVMSLLIVSLAALASADEPVATPSGPERILQAQRNQKLVEKLVAGSLDLARAVDRLDRAKFCNELAKTLADEIKQAADDHDGDRAVELGRHLQDLLKIGVAANLNKERSQIPQGSSRETEMTRVWDTSEQITSPLMADLTDAMKDNPAALGEVLKSIKEAQGAFAVISKDR